MPKQTTELTFHTITEAAAETGLPRNVIADAKKRAPQLVLTDGGRLRLRGLCQWLRQRHPTPEEDNLERLRRIKADREAFRLAKDRGEHYLAADADEVARRAVAKMQRELQRRLLAVVPGEAAGMDPRGVKRVLEDHLAKWADYAQAEAAKIAKEMRK